MSDFQDTRDRLSEAPVLLIDNDANQCRLIDRAETMRRMVESTDAFAAGTMMDLDRAAVNFATLAGREDREFLMADIEAVTALPRATIENWIGRGLLAPSIRAGDGGGRNKQRLFSWGDAFAAGALASLRRQGVAIPMLKKVSQLLRHAEVPVIN